MKKMLFIFSLLIWLGSPAQDDVPNRQLLLLDKLHHCFTDKWVIENTDPLKKMKWDSLLLPSRFLLRANIFMPGSTLPALVYFFDTNPQDSVLMHFLKNSFITAFRDTAATETDEGYISINSNSDYLAFIFCNAEITGKTIQAKFSDETGMAMPKLELKLTEIKQEKKYIKPPPPPPTPARPTKNKQKKKG